MESQTQPVIVSRDEQVTILTLNAPARRNAISLEMRIALRDALRAAIDDPQCRAIVITGAEGNFSSGADIEQMQSGEAIDIDRVRMRYLVLHDAVTLMTQGPKPVIAAVEGHALGAGLSVAAACDFVVASQTARFAAAFGKVGLIADCGLLWTMPSRMGTARTKDFLFGGAAMNAADAAACGLADALCEPGEALAQAVERARGYCDVAPLTIAETKALMAGQFSSFEAFLAAESKAQDRMVRSRDHNEGRAAFAQKRRPLFTGQ